MLLIIQHHSKPQELVTEFDRVIAENKVPNEQFDKEGLEMLKAKMAQGTRFRIK